MNSAVHHVHTECPMRATTSVKTWLDLQSFGFLWNPDKEDAREIFVHRDCVPERPRIGQRLTITEIVHITYEQDRKGRLRATKIEFPNPDTYTFTLNGQRDTAAITQHA